MGLSSFLMQNALKTEHELIQVSDRFVDPETGEAEFWEIRALDAAEQDECEKRATKMVRVGKTDRYEAKTDNVLFGMYTVTKAVVYPNLLDKELQESYGVQTPEALLNRMLKPGERSILINACNKLNGYVNPGVDEAIDESKN